MLNKKYQITGKLGHFHPYTDEVAKLQNKFLSALLSGILNKLISDIQDNIANKIRLFYDAYWNQIKDYNGFKKATHKNVVDDFITANRNLLLFKKVLSIFYEEAEELATSHIIHETTEKIPQELCVELLEELLDRFMKEEQLRLSAEDENPFWKKHIEGESANTDPISSSQPEDHQEPELLPEDLDKEIDTIQLQKQTRFAHFLYRESKTNLSKVQYELSQFLHQKLVEFYPHRNKPTLIYEYISSLEAIPELIEYVNRPVYKLLLRVRNILILSYFKRSATFSKDIIRNLVNDIANCFSEELEMAIAISFAKTTRREELDSYVRATIYPILCMIQKRIINNHIVTEIPREFQDNEMLSSVYISGVRELQIYNPIPQKDFLINNAEEIYLKVVETLNQSNNYQEIRIILNQIFLKAAEELAYSKSIPTNSATFEQDFFGNNSSNSLLEFSRHFLSKIALSDSGQLSTLIQAILNDLTNFPKLISYIDTKFPTLSTWTVYLPIKGIKVDDDSHKAFFPELNASTSELYQVKFVSAKILDSISFESFSEIFNQPVLIGSGEADACAVIESITARNGYQAATTAITILIESIQAQFFFMKYGYHHHIKIYEQVKSGTVCFCKNDSGSALENHWSISIIPCIARRSVIEFELNEQTEKFFALPSRFFKRLVDRTQRPDALGRLAQDLTHCIKLFRKGYFAELVPDQFRIYWTILDTILLPEDCSGTAIHLIPYRVSILCLGIENLVKPGDTYTYEQARLWMREDIEDFYTLMRNPLIHKGIEHAPAYERLIERIETIVNIVLHQLVYYIIYLPIPEEFLENGLDGIISFLEQINPETALVSSTLNETEDA